MTTEGKLVGVGSPCVARSETDSCWKKVPPTPVLAWDSGSSYSSLVRARPRLRFIKYVDDTCPRRRRTSRVSPLPSVLCLGPRTVDTDWNRVGGPRSLLRREPLLPNLPVVWEGSSWGCPVRESETTNERRYSTPPDCLFTSRYSFDLSVLSVSRPSRSTGSPKWSVGTKTRDS